MSKIPKMIRAADCLVLPSEHEGWGAVTSEALMVGIPVICSNACGSSIVVKASGVGGIFLCNNQKSLTRILIKQYKECTFYIKKKKRIIRWAKCLDANSGAKYLDSILNNTAKILINPPWKN
jgi:glycosyltransferase involved in cell wall biosynthesis